ncbi:hypothetical protein C0416_02930 [bacterium]|nr:hypothetical protein [bacterium]
MKKFDVAMGVFLLVVIAFYGHESFLPEEEELEMKEVLPVLPTSVDVSVPLVRVGDSYYNGNRQCNAGDERLCGSPLGTCKQGVEICLPSGVWSSNCVDAVLPSAEVCDGLDNDCNGSADDGLNCQCNAGDKSPCWVNKGGGIFEQGTQICLPWGSWSFDCFNKIGLSIIDDACQEVNKK